MKKFILIPVVMIIFFALVIFCVLFGGVQIHFQSEETSEEKRRMELFCALCSCVSYDKPKNNKLRKFLQAIDWDIQRLYPEDSEIKSKAFLVKLPAQKIQPSSREDPNVEILVIAGTENFNDLKIDMEIEKVPFEENSGEKILVHAGVLKYTDALLSGEVLEYLIKSRQDNPEKIFYLTGHSLGGAVAVIAAARLEKLGFDMDKIRVVTFAMPALGNKMFAEKYKDKIHLTRMVMNGDPVPEIFSVFDYVHFGEVIRYNEKRVPGHTLHGMLGYALGAVHNYEDETDNFDAVLYDKILNGIIFLGN